VDEGKASYSAYLLPEPSITYNDEVLVRIHWESANYDAWVPACLVTMDELGRRKRGQLVLKSDKEKEQSILEALSILITLVNDEHSKETVKVTRDKDTPQKYKQTLETLSFKSIQPELTSSNNVRDETPEESKTTLAVRRKEAALLKDSLALETQPFFDNKGNRPRKAPQVLSVEQPKSKMKTPVKASTGKLRKQSQIRTKNYKGDTRKEDIQVSNDTENKSKRGRTKTWTESEDQILRQKYAELGPKWSEISRTITGRSEEACRVQFSQSVEHRTKEPSMTSRGHADGRANAKIWAPKDDRTLLEMHAKHGPMWSKIAQVVGGTTYDGCRARFRRLANEKKQANFQAPPKKRIWTAKEDSILQQQYAIHGNKWCQIANSLPYRDGDMCRTRFKGLHPGRVVSNRKLSKKEDMPKMSGRTRLTEADRRILRAYVPTRYALKVK
jgi:hypothetical protein